jgi:hypothetical protein
MTPFTETTDGHFDMSTHQTPVKVVVTTNNTTNMTTYFIGSILCHETTDKNGITMVHDDRMVWLSKDDGYSSHSTDKEEAARFKSSEAVKSAAINSSGFPWYYKTKLETLKIYMVTRTLTVNEYEVT